MSSLAGAAGQQSTGQVQHQDEGRTGVSRQVWSSWQTYWATTTPARSFRQADDRPRGELSCSSTS